MTAERRTDELIRSEIATEREQLGEALAELRAGVRAKRRLAAAVGTLVAAGIAAAATLKIARRVRGE